MSIINFSTLSYNEQIVRFDALANDAVTAYGMAGADINFIAYTNNTMYKVSDGGQDYALRITRPKANKPLAWIRSELVFLTHLSKSLHVPEPIGEPFIGELAGVDGDVICTMFKWVDGKLGNEIELTLDQLNAIGQFIGKLHDCSATFTPPQDFDRPTLDWDGLFGENSPYNPGEDGNRHFINEHRTIIYQVTERIRDDMNELGEDDFGLIHADLIAKNIIIDGETIGAIDFDDCSYGYYLYDLSPMLWFSREDERLADIRDALWDGYTIVRNVPATHKTYLNTFLAARHVASCRWVAGHSDHPAIRGQAETIIGKRVDEMKQFLDTGEFKWWTK